MTAEHQRKKRKSDETQNELTRLESTTNMKNVTSLILRGTARILIDEAGRIVSEDEIEVEFDAQSGTVDIIGGASTVIGNMTFSGGGGIAGLSGGTATVFNGGSGMSISNNTVSFGGIKIAMRNNNTLQITAPESTMLELNKQLVGSVGQVLSGSNNAALSSATPTPEQRRQYCIALDSARVERIEMSGSTVLRFANDAVFQNVKRLALHASGSAKFKMPSSSQTFDALDVHVSGAACASFHSNHFATVDVNASGASRVSQLVALHRATTDASGASVIALSAYSKDIVRKHVSGVAQVNVSLVQ